MFERHHEKREAVAYEAAMANWQAERDTLAALVDMARVATGESAAGSLALGPDEHLFATVSSVSLIQERRSRGGAPNGISGSGPSVPAPGGRVLRYLPGASRGSHLEGTPAPNAIDSGTMHVTDQRVVFEGHTQTRECRFDDLRAVQVGSGATTFAAANGIAPTTIHYGADLDGWFGFRLELAMSHHRGEVPALVDRLSEQLRELEARKPRAPATSVRPVS